MERGADQGRTERVRVSNREVSILVGRNCMWRTGEDRKRYHERMYKVKPL